VAKTGGGSWRKRWQTLPLVGSWWWRLAAGGSSSSGLTDKRRSAAAVVRLFCNAIIDERCCAPFCC